VARPGRRPAARPPARLAAGRAVVLVRRRKALAGRALGPGPHPPGAAAAGHGRRRAWLWPGRVSAGRAWRQILAAGGPPGPPAGYHAIYGRSQIAKYLPGNCFHFVGRQVLGRALGHSQAALALASLIETALLVALATALALPLAQARIGVWALALPAGALLFLALALAAPGLLGARFWPTADAGRSRGPAAGAMVRAAMLQGSFFTVAGGVLWALAAALAGAGSQALGPLTSLSTLALAWVAGFVVPGASAGIGVREAVLILALNGALGAEASTAVALMLRVVTTIGDAVWFGLALALPLPRSAPPNPVHHQSLSTVPDQVK
jgi:glycosyltransferase 2 family protein